MLCVAAAWTSCALCVVLNACVHAQLGFSGTADCEGFFVFLFPQGNEKRRLPIPLSALRWASQELPNGGTNQQLTLIADAVDSCSVYHLKRLTVNVLEVAPAVDPPFEVTDPVPPAMVVVVPVLLLHNVMEIILGLRLAENGVTLAHGLIESNLTGR